MPLPFDEQVVKTSESLVNQLQTIFGKHPGFRPAHARGILLTGTFTPTPEAASLSSALHFKSASTTPITVRFSSSTGLPQIPDTDPDANPRGLAIRFNLPQHDGRRAHTDVVVHSTPFFPTRTGAEFLEFLQAVAASPAGTPSPTPVELFVGSHPSTLAFVQAPKPAPASFATEAYYAVTALKLINAEGKTTYFRYQILPDAGEENVDEATLKERDPNFLYDELPRRVVEGPVGFSLYAQLAEDGDVTDDATVHWPATRPLVKLGTLEVESAVESAEQEREQKNIIFDPIPRVHGIEPSEDPLLELRAAVYLISGRQRRAA